MESVVDVPDLDSMDVGVIEDWVKILTCPRCGAVSNITEKRFNFGVFVGVGYYCPDCERKFSAYYRDFKINHTNPSGEVEIIEYEEANTDEIVDQDESADNKGYYKTNFSSPEDDVEQETEEVVPTTEPNLIEETPLEEPIEEEGLPEEHFIEEEKDEPSDKSDTGTLEDVEPDRAPVIEETPIVEEQEVPAEVNLESDEIMETIRRLREDVGQISELSSEEGLVVDAFSKAFMLVMSPLTQTLPVDVSVIPSEYGPVERANIIPQGKLVLLHRDGNMTSIDLTEVENRDLLVRVIADVMPRFNTFISKRRQRIEKRLSYLSSVTKELQSIADAFAQGSN